MLREGRFGGMSALAVSIAPVFSWVPFSWTHALILSALLLLMSWFYPSFFRVPMKLSDWIIRQFSRLLELTLLSIVYFIFFTPMACWMRWRKKSPLNIEYHHKNSGWIVRDPPGPSPETMNHQF